MNHSAKNGLPFDLGVFDLDGTVLDRNLRITGRTVGALRRLRERGVRLVVATGRRYQGALEHAEKLGFGEEDPIICFGGSMIRRMNGETLLHRTVARDASVRVLEWAAHRGLHARVFIDQHIVTSPDTPAALKYLRQIEEPEVSVVGDLPAWLGEGDEVPTKLVLVDHPDNIGNWLGEAQDTFAGSLFVTRSLPHYVEVGGLEGTKSRALEFMCDLWSIDPGRVIAFGDADNDVDMLRFAGHGVAVGGANEEVRAAADATALPVDEDGVAVYVEKLLGKL